MFYISIDIETTGLDRENHQLLEIGAIVEDTLNELPFEKIPKFHAIIAHDELVGSIFALNLNQRIIKILAERPHINEVVERHKYDTLYNIVSINDLAHDFNYWAAHYLKITDWRTNTPIKFIVAGKNYLSFDADYLNRIPRWSELNNTGHKALDPVGLFVDFMNDTELPSLDVCLERAGIRKEVAHDAIEDAWDVIKVLRTKY